jgi:hypothetical protein
VGFFSCKSTILSYAWLQQFITYHCETDIALSVRFVYVTLPPGSRDSSVGITTRYGLEGPGIESLWGEIFRTIPDRLRGPPSLLYNGYLFFPGGKGGRGVMLTTHPLLVQKLRKFWAIISTHPMGPPEPVTGFPLLFLPSVPPLPPPPKETKLYSNLVEEI